MTLKTIYIVRHGYRLNWVVDAKTGTYYSTYPTPTGIPSDPALASYGQDQAQQLADKIATLDPFPDMFYSSPFYRCIQTIKPAFEQVLQSKGDSVRLRIDNGLGEFFGTARFEHPQSAKIDVLGNHFGWIMESISIRPARTGETLPGLHNRFAYALHHIIEEADKDPNTQAIIICTHAAGMIALGRALTGRMPEDPNEEDFRCGTCALSRFDRRDSAEAVAPVKAWDPTQPDEIPAVDWRSGKGVQGGWDCTSNGDCSFLKGGEERTW